MRKEKLQLYFAQVAFCLRGTELSDPQSAVRSNRAGEKFSVGFIFWI